MNRKSHLFDAVRVKALFLLALWALTFPIYSQEPPKISINRSHLSFGSIISGPTTDAQFFLISNSGGGALQWSVGENMSWLNVSPTSGTGSGSVNVSVDAAGLSQGTYMGTIAVIAPDATNSPKRLSVYITVRESGSPPFGQFDTPADGSTVSGSIYVSGWALDDVGVKHVRIYNGTTYIGYGIFAVNSRPDVEQSFPGYPLNYRGGWSCDILTDSLPNGVCTLYARATDKEGNTVTLGSKTITVNNPTLTLTSPNGGESWEAGDSRSIQWVSTGSVGYVKIEYSTDNGSNWITVISSTSNDGFYSWTIPASVSTQCLMRIKEASDGSPSDTSDDVFTIAPMPALTLTTPNGGESWEAGTSQSIQWVSTGSVGNVKIEYSTDNGGSWAIVSSAAANTGNYLWTVPAVESTNCQVRIGEAADGSPSDTSDAAFTIYTPVPPEITLSRAQLNFGSIISGATTDVQSIRIVNTGGGTLQWAAGSTVDWCSVNPAAGTGNGTVYVSVDAVGLSAGTYEGAVTISASDPSTSPQSVSITLMVYQSGDLPFGIFATPVDGSTVNGSVPVTGWVLDDVGVENVKIYRGEGKNLVYIGDAVFVEGARPDVELAYPGYPMNYKAGWGYMMLTDFLPDGGNGTFEIHAVAVDSEGHQVKLGTKTIVCDNDDAVKPFGAIDTPTQGGIASGSNFINWGWVLTPQPNSIPTDGSTINVYVDGVNIGHPTYNNYRSDIANLFPGYANSNGAVGYFYLDTTAYEDGVHIIQWTAVDSAGNTDGIGSRYFIIQNTAGSGSTSIQKHFRLSQNSNIPDNQTGPAAINRGYGKDRQLPVFEPDIKEISSITIKELEPVEIKISPQASGIFGYSLVGNELQPLPIGSTLEMETGKFYWSPGPGFCGDYELVFIESTETGGVKRKHIKIRISPKFLK